MINKCYSICIKKNAKTVVLQCMVNILYIQYSGIMVLVWPWSGLTRGKIRQCMGSCHLPPPPLLFDDCDVTLLQVKTVICLSCLLFNKLIFISLMNFSPLVSSTVHFCSLKILWSSLVFSVTLFHISLLNFSSLLFIRLHCTSLQETSIHWTSHHWTFLPWISRYWTFPHTSLHWTLSTTELPWTSLHWWTSFHWACLHWASPRQTAPLNLSSLNLPINFTSLTRFYSDLLRVKLLPSRFFLSLFSLSLFSTVSHSFSLSLAQFFPPGRGLELGSWCSTCRWVSSSPWLIHFVNPIVTGWGTKLQI